MARHNTFSKMGGSVYVCATCGRKTRHTGAQAIGSELCPQCWELAGIENSISDGAKPEEYKSEVESLAAEIESKAGKLTEWAGLLAAVRA